MKRSYPGFSATVSPGGGVFAVVRVMTVEMGVRVPSGEGQPGREVASAAGFYRAHAAELMRFATSLVGPHDASDVVADAMAKTLAAREWSSIDQPRAYVYRAVYREAMSWRRAAKRRSERRVADAGHLGAIERVGEPGDSFDGERVAQAIRSLSTRQRAVVFLAYWEDRRIEDIAQILRTSDGSVRKHLARAREALRSALGEDEGDT
jgi:RNA polymerase sigma-70 factor (ECF subfamily)